MKTSLPKSRGFTLIELIVVIVILGIMAAVAGPKFVDLQKDARISVLDGIDGSLKSAATLIYSKSLINGTENLFSSTVTSNGGPVTTRYGYPTNNTAGIEAVIELSSDITVRSGGDRFELQTNCYVNYIRAERAAGVTTPATTSRVITGC